MSIKLIDNNHDTLYSEKYSSCHLTAKFRENYPDSKKSTVYLITNEKVLTKTLLSKFDRLIDNFEAIHTKLAVFDQTYDNNVFVPEGPCLIVGGTNEWERFTKVFGKNAVHISKHSDNEMKTIGHQRHLSNDCHAESCSLGELTNDIKPAESLIRNADALFIKLSALAQHVSHFKHSSVLGLDFYNCAKLVRTAGITQKNQVIFIDTEDEVLSEETEEIISVLFWYYLEGIKFRKIEDIENSENTTYLVDSPFYSEPIKFIRGKVTNRWWFIHPNNGESMACTASDYETLKSGNIPDVFMTLID